jgi:hypothetical protein
MYHNTTKCTITLQNSIQYSFNHLLHLFLKEILHQFWVKKFFPWKFNLEYGGTFTKLFMHVSSRNMFPTIRNLQIRVHVYRPCHCCGDWLNFGCFVPMIADHDLVTKSVCFMSCKPFLLGAIILMWYTQNIFMSNEGRHIVLVWFFLLPFLLLLLLLSEACPDHNFFVFPDRSIIFGMLVHDHKAVCCIP